MKIVIASLMALTAAGASIPALTQDQAKEATQDKQAKNSDADKLYALVKKARGRLREVRRQAGLHPHAPGPHIDPPGSHANDSPEQARRERAEKEGHEEGGHEGRGEKKGREGRGEHGGRGEGRGERKGREGRGERKGREGRGEHGGRGEGRGERKGREGRGEHGGRGEGRGEGMGEEAGNRIPKMAKHDKVYTNGARLVLQYNPYTQVFVGKVTNTTRKTLSQVRVEIHLSNGVELGPTKRVNLKPGATIPVELGAFGNEFTAWVTHPEAGVEAGHGPGGEEGGAGHAEREKGEHGAFGGDGKRGEHGGRGEGKEGGDNRPSAANKPLYNQIQILRGEIQAFQNELKAKSKK